MSTDKAIFEDVPGYCLHCVAAFVVVFALGACAAGPAASTSPETAQAKAAESGDDDDDDDPQQAIATSVPDTDIFVFHIDPALPEIVQSFDANVTRRLGYDNQPSYLPGTNDFIFSSILDGTQSDVYLYREATRTLIQRTRTAISEYSPTPLMDGGFSSVVVEEDGTQRLWRYSASGVAKEPVREDVTGVVYHAWLPGDLLALFIVDQPLMHLDVVGVNDTSRYTLAVNGGRSLHRRPGTDSLSFVQHLEGERSRLMKWDGVKLETLATMPEGVEDITWLPDGRALTIAEHRLLVWTPGASDWQAVFNLAEYLPGEVTRLAVNDAATRLAIVSGMTPQE